MWNWNSVNCIFFNGCFVFNCLFIEIYSYTCGFDIDEDALSIAQENISNYELNIDLVKCDISKLELNSNNDYLFDTIVMNPPFGTRDKGIDMKFVEKALCV